MSIYLDNAATTFPKPPAVYAAVQHAMAEVGANPGRASHRRAREALAMVSDTRRRTAEILGIPDPDRVAFTKSATESINVVLKGWLRPGDKVLTSGLEHNSVVRPLARLETLGVRTEIIPCSRRGELDLEGFARALEGGLRLVVLTHASNVNGALLPIPRIARMCRESGVPLFLDAAQTAGVQPISAGEWDLGMLACSGHKGLLGPAGVGVLYVREDLDVLPLVEGGTGSRSEDPRQPGFCPDRYESGTLNFPGIAGLGAGIRYLLEEGLETVLNHELKLAAEIEDGLSELNGVEVLRPSVRGTGVVSFTVEGMSPDEVAFLLDKAFDIAVRSGLHCAPQAHRTLGTFPSGTVRVSPGHMNTPEQIDSFLRSVHTILQHRR
ncbi:MAG TPA: aminotransferase class V-fold PLP-dependent enzyme [Syntrophobacteraceae bacterium]|nr:aminotransferase class V-fold PLP-dependent enzyme [Syntrophobacteraceae bacterium]